MNKALEILEAILEQEENALLLKDGSFFKKDYIKDAISELQTEIDFAVAKDQEIAKLKATIEIYQNHA